jgi:uncharacterized protein YjiS (DUF1127 family)
MTTRFPILPIAGSALLRAFASLLAFMTRWIRQLLRARRHWHEATALAGLDRRMLADIGITRADLNDAFSEPFWDDPTALLRERALERRVSLSRKPDVEKAFRRPPTNRPARQAM